MSVVEQAAEVLRLAPKWNGTRFDPLSPMEAARALDEAGLLIVDTSSPEHEEFVAEVIDEWKRNKALTEAVLDAAERDWLEGTKDTRRALHIAVHARREARS